ncbi:hypothetical protein RUM43_008570 [Polyplax serrata]|uniref:Uncharacterized protein n=1 Tax=Polyplax serrata TaxID=468196 RepID=A0AAN8S834_POLSC
MVIGKKNENKRIYVDTTNFKMSNPKRSLVGDKSFPENSVFSPRPSIFNLSHSTKKNFPEESKENRNVVERQQRLTYGRRASEAKVE